MTTRVVCSAEDTANWQRWQSEITGAGYRVSRHMWRTDSRRGCGPWVCYLYGYGARRTVSVLQLVNRVRELHGYPEEEPVADTPDFGPREELPFSFPDDWDAEEEYFALVGEDIY